MRLCVCGATISGTAQLVVGWGQGVICLLLGFGTVWSCLGAASVSLRAACSCSWRSFSPLGVITCYNSSHKVSKKCIPSGIWAEATKNDLIFSWEISNFLFFCKVFMYLVLCLLALFFFQCWLQNPKAIGGRLFFPPLCAFQMMLEISSGEW